MKNYFNTSVIGSYIDGQLIKEGKEKKPYLSYVTGKQESALIQADVETIEQALKAAQRCSLGQMTCYERSDMLMAIHDRILSEKEALSTLITTEMGKPIREARAEIDYSAGYFKWFAEEAKRIYGREIPSQHANKRLQVRHEPIGPVAVITPWNFPLAMAARKLAPAWAAGCPVIAKPSSVSPLTMLYFASLLRDVPKGTLSVLIGDAETISDALMDSPTIRKISFTGSVEAGQSLYEKCAKTVKKATLELGGHAPFIIFEDANLDAAIEGAIVAKFRNTGQTCICANRFLIHESILEECISRLKKRISALKVGDPFDEKTEVSNVIHPTSTEKVIRHIDDALKKGAEMHLQKKKPYNPQIVSGITKKMLLFHEETFGPLLGITTFSTEEEAVSLANDTKYGLASYCYTQDISRAERMMRALEYGIVSLNDGLPSSPQVPFGGVKYSGFGREGGPSGMYEYLTEKLISLCF